MKRWGYLFICYAMIFASCTCQSTYERVLVEADNLIEQHSDSALHLLEGMVDILEKGDESNRAYYTLLLTQARYMCYKPVPTDSLMRSAVCYYEKSGNLAMLCRAYYYRAMPLYEQGQHEEALLLLKKGEELATRNHNQLYMAKYHESLCMVNYQSQNHPLMLKYARLSLDDAIKLNDTAKITRSLSHISTALYRIGAHSESKNYILKSLSLAKKIDKETKAYILSNVGVACHSAGNTDFARYYLAQSLRIKPLPHTFAELGNVYAESGNMEEAEKNWKEALKAGDAQTVLDVLTSMQNKYEQQNNYKSAIEISNRRDVLKDSLFYASKQATLADIQHKYDKQVIENKYYKALTWLFGIILLIIIIIIGYYFYHRRMVRRFTSKLFESRLAVERAAQEIERLESSEEKHVKEVEKLKKSIADIRRQDYEKIGYGKVIYEKVKANKTILYRKEEESLIEYYTVFHHETYNQWMNTYKNLTIRPIVYLILADMGKSDQEIQGILGVTNGAIRVMKSRLNAKKV